MRSDKLSAHEKFRGEYYASVIKTLINGLSSLIWIKTDHQSSLRLITISFVT